MAYKQDTELVELNRNLPMAFEYLVAIYVIYRDYGAVGNTQLADWIGVTKPAVSQAMGRLKSQELVRQLRYGGISLTEKGNSFAERILKRHYLLEHMLIKNMNYPWDKSDEEAQNMQAVISSEFEAFLFETFGKPQTCPHGNPFPGTKLEKELVNAPRLSAVTIGASIIVVRITEEGEAYPGLLQFCNKHLIRPSCKMTIKKATPKSIVAEIDGNEVSIPKDFADFICFRLKDSDH